MDCCGSVGFLSGPRFFGTLTLRTLRNTGWEKLPLCSLPGGEQPVSKEPGMWAVSDLTGP